MITVETFGYDEKKGWSIQEFPALNNNRTILFLFAAEKFKENTKPIEQICEVYKHSHTIGCSTAGEIFQNHIVDDSIVVAVVQFEKTDIKMIHIDVKDKDDSFNVGQEIVEQLLNDDLQHIFLLSDGLNVNGTELTNGITKSLPNDVLTSGGLAGDGSRFQTTWTFSKERGIQLKAVAALGFYGKHIKVKCGTQGGWDPFGPERIITKSDKNILYEIDHKPALTLYKTYLGELAKDLPSSALLYPLTIRANRNYKNPMVRTILAVDEATQSLTFAGDVPETWLAQLMTANFDRLIEGASNAADEASIKNISSNCITIAISCIGRRLVLGERTDEELAATLENLPEQTKQIGFYSYGEISPSGLINCELHNQTMTLTTFYEE